MATSTEIYATLTGANYSGTANNFGNSTCLYSSKGFKVFTITAYTFICVIGVILNSLAFWVYFCHVPNSNSIIVYLKNLVIADLLLVLSLPIKILRDNEVNSKSSLNIIYCNFVACIFYLNIYSSILFLGYIAATRYLKIVKPLKTHAFQNLKTAKRLSLGTWGAILLLGILFAFLINMEKQPVPNSQTCIKIGTQQKTIYTFAHIAGIITFLCVLVGLCFFYFQISRQLHQSSSAQSLKKQTKAKNNILILIAVFLVCFVPYHIIRLPYILTQINVISDCFWQRILYYAKESSLLLSTLNACFDPVIYFLFCKAFRSKLGLDKKAKGLHLNEISVPVNASHIVLD
ncbi:P2Y purinoceptor 14-like [Heptranchias perlo]|uniref:P2Y purinoceptor 14-like n=1 Tax=Heptranchias perlo TaxID=212740 RepID=UPI003559D5EF